MQQLMSLWYLSNGGLPCKVWEPLLKAESLWFQAKVCVCVCVFYVKKKKFAVALIHQKTQSKLWIDQ